MKSTALKIIAFAILLPFVAVGCADISPTLKGGAIGAGAGAATGAVAGAILGEPGKGAGVGAVVGGAVGLILGEFYSQSQKQQAEANQPKPPSDSYSTTLPSPSAKTQNEPLLLLDLTSMNTDEALVVKSMSLMKGLLADRGIKSEEYNISSSVKYPNASIVSLEEVFHLPGTDNSPQGRYGVALKLNRPGVKSQVFYGFGPNLAVALSQALFGK